MSFFDAFDFEYRPTLTEVHQMLAAQQPRHCQYCLEVFGGRMHGIGWCIQKPLTEERIRQIIREEIKAALVLP